MYLRNRLFIAHSTECALLHVVGYICPRGNGGVFAYKYVSSSSSLTHPIHSMKTREERGLYALSLPSRSLPPPPCLNSPGCVEYRPVIAVRPHQDRKDVRYMYVRLCVYVCARMCVVFCIGYRTLLARCESTHIQLSCNRVNNTPYRVCVCVSVRREGQDLRRVCFVLVSSQ